MILDVPISTMAMTPRCSAARRSDAWRAGSKSLAHASSPVSLAARARAGSRQMPASGGPSGVRVPEVEDRHVPLHQVLRLSQRDDPVERDHRSGRGQQDTLVRSARYPSAARPPGQCPVPAAQRRRRLGQRERLVQRLARAVPHDQRQVRTACAGRLPARKTPPVSTSQSPSLRRHAATGVRAVTDDQLAVAAHQGWRCGPAAPRRPPHRLEIQRERACGELHGQRRPTSEASGPAPSMAMTLTANSGRASIAAQIGRSFGDRPAVALAAAHDPRRRRSSAGTGDHLAQETEDGVSIQRASR